MNDSLQLSVIELTFHVALKHVKEYGQCAKEVENYKSLAYLLTTHLHTLNPLVLQSIFCGPISSLSVLSRL